MSSAHSPDEQAADAGSFLDSNQPSPDPSIALNSVGLLDQPSELGLPNEPRRDQQPSTNPPVWNPCPPRYRDLLSKAVSRIQTRVYDSRWPDWARPEEDLPTATARDLHDRAARLRETQFKVRASISYAVQDRSWSKTLQLLPQDSAVWATLIRSRWLVVETIKGNLELWDIEGPCENRPVATFNALHGSVDGFYVSGGPNGVVELSISTTSFHVYTFDIDLPHRCESRLSTPRLVPKDILPGWGGLKDNMEGTWAFTKHQGTTNQGFLYSRGPHPPSVHLACASDVEENQKVIDILLRPNVIAVARNRSIDMYNPSTMPTLINTQSGEALPYLTLDHSFPCPKSYFIHKAKLLQRNPAGLKMADDRSIAYAVYLDEGWMVSEIQCDLVQDHSGPSRKYNMLPPRQVATVSANTLALLWGESGSRMVELNDWQLIMKFAASQTLPDGSARSKDNRDGPDVNYYRTLAVWPMPLELGDIPRCVAFDEATGVAAVGMASGTVLVADAADTGFLPPLRQSNLDDDDGHFGSPYIRFKPAESPPHPSCKEWHGLARNPAMHKPRKIKSPDLASEGAPGWTRDVERYYPHANDPSYYLSIPWLIRDLAGIPFGARCLMVSSEQIDPIKGANAAIIEVEVEFGIGGRLLLLLWGDGVEWQLFKFRSLVTSDNIVSYLQNGVILATLCDPKPLSLDPVILGQWEVWGVRRQAAKQMNKKM